jgi:hypothetical protein
MPKGNSLKGVAAAGKFMRKGNEPLEFSTLLKAISADEPYGQRIAEFLTFIGFDGCHDDQDKEYDSQRDQEDYADDHYDQDGGDNAVDRERYLEIKGFFPLVIHERRFIFFDQPDNKGPDDVAERKHEDSQRR